MAKDDEASRTRTVTQRRKDPRRFTDWTPENVQLFPTAEPPRPLTVERRGALKVPRIHKLTRDEAAAVCARAERNLARSRQVHSRLLINGSQKPG